MIYDECSDLTNLTKQFHSQSSKDEKHQKEKKPEVANLYYGKKIMVLAAFIFLFSKRVKHMRSL